MLAEVHSGDTIITLEVSRLVRSAKQLCEIIDVIRDKRLRLVIASSITMDCRDGQMTPMTAAFLQIAGVFSQLELSMIRSRVRSGRANAKAKGKHIGRPPVSDTTIPDLFYRYNYCINRAILQREVCLWILFKMQICRIPQSAQSICTRELPPPFTGLSTSIIFQNFGCLLRGKRAPSASSGYAGCKDKAHIKQSGDACILCRRKADTTPKYHCNLYWTFLSCK